MFWNLFLQQVHLSPETSGFNTAILFEASPDITKKNKHKTFNGSFDLPLISLVLEFAFFSNAYTQMVK